MTDTKYVQDCNGKLAFLRDEGSANITILQQDQIININVYSVGDVINILKDLMPIHMKHAVIAKILLTQ